MLRNRSNQIFQSLKQPSFQCGSVGFEPLSSKTPRTGSESKPLVSVITVTFNAEETIEAAIRSVAEQTYEEIEYIIIDGNSIDKTREILNRNLAYIDCLISEPDEGIYDAMNKGLMRAQGKYVAILNADDRLFPNFVGESVRALEKSGNDVSYCDYVTENGPVSVGEINDGLYLSQLGIKHNTFLMHRDCFAKLGAFDSQLKIVADAKWNRAAYAGGLRFEKVPGRHVFYSTKGVSAAATTERRNQIINESANLIIDCFPELDFSQATALYLSNFNTFKTDQIIDLDNRMRTNAPTLSNAINEAIRWNIINRPGYRVKADDFDSVVRAVKIANHLGMALTEFVVDEPVTEKCFNLPRFFATLEEARQRSADLGQKVCMHFARVFSAPSETFIYDFLSDLSAANDGFTHVMLCDERKNSDERPFDLTLNVPWNDLPKNLRRFLYDLIWNYLNPERVVAHFALNGWVLHDRLSPEQRHCEWINMCHGIDVFVHGNNPSYTAYISEYCALAPNVVFTAVSRYLADLLHKTGVPEEKVFHVPNAVRNNFQATRKKSGYWDGARPLRVLSIGRLIEWKGHQHLLRALAEIRVQRPDMQIDLEVVYGRWDQCLPELEELRHSLDLPGDVIFTDFVDFQSRPDFIPSFDLFVLPSTESDDPLPRTETFGVAVIEAIAAGLPVIATDAGGIPEVIGAENPQAALVKHGAAKPIADALIAMLDAREATFSDNAEYANARIKKFSSSARQENWKKVIDWFSIPRKKIFHFCALGCGGAAGAALNIHKGLLRKGYDSWYVTRGIERSNIARYAPNVIALSPENTSEYDIDLRQKRAQFTFFSIDNEIISNSQLAKLVKDADVINLAWPAQLLSVRNIAMLTNLGVPVLMTLRDMNQISGGCHFFHGCEQWESGCGQCPQQPEIVAEDYSEVVFRAKQKLWNFESITFVALSDHSMEILERSPISADRPKLKLSNIVDTDTFYHQKDVQLTLDDAAIRSLKIGYLPSFGSRIKGHRELLSALNIINHKRPDLNVTVLLAADENHMPDDAAFDVVHLGAIKDRNKLREFYNSADIVAVPSLEETFSNTTIEALACGTPVVGFKTGILREILADGVRGGCAEIGDTEALADHILRLSKSSPDRQSISNYVHQNYSPDSGVEEYHQAILRVLASKPTRAGRVHDSVFDESVFYVPLIENRQKAKNKIFIDRYRNIREQNHKISDENMDIRNWKAKRAKAISNLQKEQKHAIEQIESLNHELNTIFASTSWKVTSPIRSIGTRIRNFVKQLVS